MHLALAALWTWMPFAADASTARPADDAIEVLIGRFLDVGTEGMGFSTSVSGWEFLPYPGSGEAGVMLLGRLPPQPSPILRKVIEKGVAAVPALLAHIDDARPTKLPPVKRMMWMSFDDEYDYNRRLSKAPAGVEGRGVARSLRPASSRARDPDSHVITVGDLCFVALGQIVNRSFAAARYQPSGGMVISSPSYSKTLAAAVRAEWGGLTPASHRARLVEDALKPDHEYRRIGAYYRLSFYYPDAVEDVVLQILARPVFDVFKAERFVRLELYSSTSSEKRRRALDEYVKTHEAGADGVLNQLFEDLEWQEAREQGRTSSGDDWPKGDPRRLLIELFGRDPSVKSADRPIFSSVSQADHDAFMKALTHDTSRRVDEAVRAILNKTVDDDYLALSCMRRLLGRGYDNDIRRYVARRADRSLHFEDELRAILKELH